MTDDPIRHLAAFRAATAAGADPEALLDSVSFRAELASLDPADTEAVRAAVQTAVEANPRLTTAPTAQAPAPNPAQGASASGPARPAQLSEEHLRSMTPDQIVAAQNDGRLDHLLGRC